MSEDKYTSIAGKPRLIVILGPTASGKTALSLKLAKKIDGEIISADSRAIYKGLDIGSAKPTLTEQKKVPHHLIDIVSLDKTLTLAQYKKLALAKIRDIASHERVPFLVGGTALYIYSVIDNWLIPGVPPNKSLRAELKKRGVEKLWEELIKKDPQAKEFIDPKNKRRIIRALEIINATGKTFSQQREKGEPLFDVLILGVQKSPEETKKAIAKRTKQMLKAGLVAEVRKLLKKGYSAKSPALSGIHYKEIINYLNKKVPLLETVALINKNDEQLVRRQMTWFKKDKRIKWVKSQKEAEKLVKKFLE